MDRLVAKLSPQAALRRGVRLAEQGQSKRAFPLLVRAATAGIAEAEFRVGRCYLEGAGVPPSRSQGARWLERAGNQGYVEAQVLLATLYVHGLANGWQPVLPAPPPACSRPTPPCRPTSPRPRNGRAAPPRAAPPTARPCSAIILTSGPENLRNPDEALTLVREIGRRPAARKAIWATRWRWRGDGTDPGIPGADHRAICGSAAEAGLPTALYLLGMITERGLGVPADPAAAAAVLSPRRREGPSRRPGALGPGVAGRPWRRRPIRPRANPGCAAPRWPAIRRPRRWSATSMPRAASCRPTSPRPRSGSAAPPRPTTRGAARALGMLHLTGAGVGRDQDEAAQVVPRRRAGGRHATPRSTSPTCC